jgi:hypothetical protein
MKIRTNIRAGRLPAYDRCAPTDRCAPPPSPRCAPVDRCTGSTVYAY